MRTGNGGRGLMGVVIIAMLGMLMWAPAVQGWHDRGHFEMAYLSVRAVGDDLPAFFRDGAPVVAHVSNDADVNKERAFRRLRASEAPEHYFDYENFEGEDLPASRYWYKQGVRGRGMDPYETGLLPYSVTEWTQRLAMAFAEHRRWPEDEAIQQRCLFYAGKLMHYAHDLVNPLHVTIHSNGWVGEDGQVAHRGIHRRVDGVYQVVDIDAGAVLGEVELRARAQGLVEGEDLIFNRVMEEVRASHGLVERTYELEREERFPWYLDEGAQAGPGVEAYAHERMVAGARFGAELVELAWVKSGDIELPFWLDREQERGWAERLEGDLSE